MKEKIKSLLNWIPYDEILEKGIIKIKENEYIKILKIYPINFNLKTQLEKEAILNSYKVFLKSCPFNIQIIIQSKKEDLSKNIQKIKLNIKKEKNKKLEKISEKYIDFIEKINQEKKSSSKNFYLIIKNNQNEKIWEQNKEEIKNQEKIIVEELQEKYFKIKENLIRCGNIVYECDLKETQEIIYSFLNTKKFLSMRKGGENCF